MGTSNRQNYFRTTQNINKILWAALKIESKVIRYPEIKSN